MRTKTLILAAAFSAVAAASSMAQVYSANAVGYYSLNLVQGYNLIANQLINGNNEIGTVFPAVQDGSFILRWNSAAAPAGQMFGQPITYFDAVPGWVECCDENEEPFISTAVLSPGSGFFFNAPTAGTITLVGEVPESSNGTLPPVSIPNAYSIVSQPTPQQLSLGTGADALPARDGDFLLFWNPAANGYGQPITYFDAVPGWVDVVDEEPVVVDPMPTVGQAFFYNTGGSAFNWTRTFNVQ